MTELELKAAVFDCLAQIEWWTNEKNRLLKELAEYQGAKSAVENKVAELKEKK